MENDGEPPKANQAPGTYIPWTLSSETPNYGYFMLYGTDGTDTNVYKWYAWAKDNAGNTYCNTQNIKFQRTKP